MNLRGAQSREDPEINFIPLIDVLLVILIFLMVTTTYQRVAELQITLPEADADAVKQRPREVNVGIDAQGRYVVDRTPFAFSSVPALADILRRAGGDAVDPTAVPQDRQKRRANRQQHGFQPAGSGFGNDRPPYWSTASNRPVQDDRPACAHW